MKKRFGIYFETRGSVNIDGRDLVGRSVIINGDKVLVDGVEEPGSLVGPIYIAVTGNVERLESGSGNVEVSGACGSVQTMSGDVICGNVDGSVKTMSGDVTCGAVSGSVNSLSGDVRMGGAR